MNTGGGEFGLRGLAVVAPRGDDLRTTVVHNQHLRSAAVQAYYVTDSDGGFATVEEIFRLSDHFKIGNPEHGSFHESWSF